VNVAVVGGAGFIGSHLVDRLLAEGHVVDVVDDLSTGSLANLTASRASGGELKFHHVDVGTDLIDGVVRLRRPTVLYHLAAVPRVPSPLAYTAGVVERTASVLEACASHHVTKVVTMLPAAAVYGTPAAKDLPLKERAFEARSVDGVVAAAVLGLLEVYRSRHDLEFTCLVAPTVYGSRQRVDGGEVAALVDAHRTGAAAVVAGDLRDTRDLVHVDDVVDALERSAHRGGGLVINVGTGTQTSLLDLWRAIAGHDAAPPGTGPAGAEPPRMALSSARARIHLQWSAWTDLVDGLAEIDR
jgi:UDP-glucose 4-epimerase